MTTRPPEASPLILRPVMHDEGLIGLHYLTKYIRRKIPLKSYGTKNVPFTISPRGAETPSLASVQKVAGSNPGWETQDTRKEKT